MSDALDGHLLAGYHLVVDKVLKMKLSEVIVYENNHVMLGIYILVVIAISFVPMMLKVCPSL